jgi:hypothetical protein
LKILTVKSLGLAFAIAAGFTTAANAQVVYTWVPWSGNGVATSGTLDVSASGAVTSLTFVDGTYATYNNFTALPAAFGGPANGLGTAVLADGDVVLTGVSTVSGLDTLQWDPNGNTAQPLQEQNVQDSYFTQGNWVPTAVPEPTTVIAGMLMLLPFGASMVRILRRNRAA